MGVRVGQRNGGVVDGVPKDGTNREWLGHQLWWPVRSSKPVRAVKAVPGKFASHALSPPNHSSKLEGTFARMSHDRT
jgi:hypothetical protein